MIQPGLPLEPREATTKTETVLVTLAFVNVQPVFRSPFYWLGVVRGGLNAKRNLPQPPCPSAGFLAREKQFLIGSDLPEGMIIILQPSSGLHSRTAFCQSPDKTLSNRNSFLNQSPELSLADNLSEEFKKEKLSFSLSIFLSR
jgi:hypothetical protein